MLRCPAPITGVTTRHQPMPCRASKHEGFRAAIPSFEARHHVSIYIGWRFRYSVPGILGSEPEDRLSG